MGVMSPFECREAFKALSLYISVRNGCDFSNPFQLISSSSSTSLPGSEGVASHQQHGSELPLSLSCVLLQSSVVSVSQKICLMWLGLGRWCWLLLI